MSYINMINQFWKMDSEKPFSSVETRLYFLLLKYANNAGLFTDRSSDHFTQTNRRLASDCDISERVLIRAKNVLKVRKLIDFKCSNKKGDITKYFIVGLLKVTPLVTPNVTPNGSQTVSHYKNKDKDKDKKSFDMSFVEIEFKEAFFEWLEYKKERKENYKTQKSLEAAYANMKQIANNNHQEAKKCINQSISNNWAGLFELKNKQKTKQITERAHFINEKNLKNDDRW